jgi:peptidoglycan/xylan/chitin deacetylase (PgdA/CDA1 family)
MKKALVIILLFGVSLSHAETKIFYADGSASSKKVALTFDDGPGKTTKKILKILEEKNVKATFFMLGSRVAKNPETAKEVAESGHEIASHTYDHLNFFKYEGENKAEKIKDELLKSEEIIEKAVGAKPFLVRYPHGYSRHDAIEAARENGYYVINWSFGTDWDLNLTNEEMYEKYAGAIKKGAIFLMHDSNTKAVNILADFIDTIIESGYEIVTVSELLGLKTELEKVSQ